MLPVVITYKKTEDKGKELKCAIRSLSNIKDWNGQLFVVGDREEWFGEDIVHIKSGRSFSPYEDVWGKLLAVIEDKQVPEMFILMMDDVYITKPITLKNYCLGELPTEGAGIHKRTKILTRDWLIANRHTTLDFEAHAPFVVEKEKLKDIYKIVKPVLSGLPYQWRSLYGNIYKLKPTDFEDKKTKTGELKKGDIISTQYYTDELAKLFPNKSRYEHDGNYSVSIVIPAYNAEEYIEKCLDSIPEHKNIKEIIVCDDGSDDSTFNLLRKYKRRKIKVLRNTQNRGVGYSFNRLIDAASGFYIARIDADDTFTPDFARVLDELDGSDVVYWDMRDNDDTIRKLKPETRMKTVACCKLYKRSFIGDTRTVETNWGEDRHLHKELIKKRPTELYTGIVAYNYNYPRQGSLTDLNRTGNIVAGQVVPKESVTLNLFTNAHKDCTTNPTIFDTYENYVKTFGKPDKVVVYCDPNPHTDDYEKYSEQIDKYFGSHVKTTGLANGYLHSLENATTDYIFQLEADWNFQHVTHSLDRIIAEMRKDSLWFMLFNQHKNIDMPHLAKWQSYLKPHNDVYSVCDRISNNPHIIEVKRYTELAKSLVDWTIGGAGRIEQVLEKKFEVAIYGKYGIPPTIRHMDSRRNEPKSVW